MKILWRVVFALSVACAADNARAQAQSFVLGAAYALTGDAATSGQAEMQAVKLAVEELNSRGKVKLELKVEDTASTGIGTVNAIKRLVEVDGVRILVGPTWLDSFQGGLPTTQQRAVLVVTPSASISVIKDTPSKYPLVFSTYFNFHRQISVLIENAYRQGIKRVAVLFDQDPYFVEMRRIIGAETARLAMRVVLDHEFSSGEDNFRPLIQRAQQQKADAIVFASANQASFLSFLKQRRQLAPGIGVLANQDFEGYKTLPAFAGMEQGILYTVPAEADREFRDAFERRYSTPPILTASNAYDAVKIIAIALEAGVTTPQQIAEFLRAHEFDTVSFGKIRFSPLGAIEGGDFVVRGELPTLGHAS